MIYRFESGDGKLLRLDTDTATLLMSTRWLHGRDSTRWSDLYRTPRGRYVVVQRTLWQGERDIVQELEESEALMRLALAAEANQLTLEGQRLLAEHDPSEEA